MADFSAAIGSPRPKPRIAVIGAGFAGLAAAVRLCEAGCDVHLFEAGRLSGGRARSIENPVLDSANSALAGGFPEDWVLDNGQHLLIGAYRRTLALVNKVCAGAATSAPLYQRRSLQILASPLRLSMPRSAASLGKYGVDIARAWALCTASGLSWREKYDAVCWLRRLQKRRFLLPGMAAATPGESEDCSVEELLNRDGVSGVLREKLWEPLCLACLNTAPKIASAKVFLRVLQDSLGSARAGDSDLIFPERGLSALLPDPATDWLQTHGAHWYPRWRVRRLWREGAAWWLAKDDGHDKPAGEKHSEQSPAQGPFAALLLCTAPRQARQLWLHNFTTACPIPDYEFEPVGTLYLAFAAPLPVNDALIYCHHPWPCWLVHHGQGRLAVVFSGKGDWQRESATGIESAVLRALAEQIGRFSQMPAVKARFWQHVAHATLSCTTNLARPSMGGEHGLWLAGDYVCAAYPSTLEGAVISGETAAQACLQAVA